MSSILTEYNNIEQRLDDQPEETMVMIENDLINNQNHIPNSNYIKKIIIDNIDDFLDSDNLDIITRNNYYHIIEVCLTSEYFKDDFPFSDYFFAINGSHILFEGDYIEIFQIIIDFMNNNKYHYHIDNDCDDGDTLKKLTLQIDTHYYRPCLRKDCTDNDDEEYYNQKYCNGEYIHNREKNELTFTQYELLFKSALVYGREKTMQYVLNNKNPLEIYEYNNFMSQGSDCFLYCAFKFYDTISHAIIGKNLNCIRTVIDVYTTTNTIKDENWEVYFTFAAVYGTMEIINYFLVIKLFMPERIEDFYNKMLKFALCNANIDVVNWALNNGAEYSQTMDTFVNDYNSIRREDYFDAHDCSDFYLHVESLPNNFKTKYHECMVLIHSYN